MKLDVKQKLAGVLVPVFALRHDDDLGIGDTTAMAQAVEFCSRHQIGVLQILPINETGGDNSPYSAISSIALDPALLTVAPFTVPGLTVEDFQSIATPAVLAELRQGPVKYPQVKALKNSLLRLGFANFEKDHLQTSSQEKTNFENFRKENEIWLEAYTLFRALVDKHDGNTCWPQWEPEYRDYNSARKLATTKENKEHFDHEQTFWAYVQWIAWGQWGDVRLIANETGVQLMGDIPFGVGRYSADVWSAPELFDLDWSCGAPPEKFFPADPFTEKWGQNWGMPYYKWSAHKKENFAWWRRRISFLIKLFHYYRIDHVLGFFRVYAFPWIPERNDEFMALTEKEAAAKCLGRLPGFKPRADEPEENALKNCAEGEEILKILMEASGDAAIVAEDLGVVPDYVRPLLKKLGIAGFTIPIFERDEETREFTPKEELPVLSLATYGTHDHQPIHSFYDGLLAWWHGPDGDKGWQEMQHLMHFLGLDPENPPDRFSADLHKTFLEILLHTPCWLTLLMITDLLGTKQRFNEPGSAGEANWSQRLEYPIDHYDYETKFADKIQTFSKLIKETCRVPAAHLDLSGLPKKCNML
jgi:4-alpha-glucanotransferase